MKNHTAQNGNIVTTLLISIVFIGLLSLSIWYFYKSSESKTQSEIPTLNQPLSQQSIQTISSSSPSQESKQYTSKNLKISFEKPKDSNIEESFNAVKISYKDGEILIDRTSTIFTSVNDHIKDLAKKNNLTYEEIKKLEINGITFSEIVLKSNLKPQGELSYFALVNGFIFVISSTDQQLNQSMELVVNSINFQ